MTDMQPETPAPQFTPERVPSRQASSSERLPQLPTPETGIEQGAERKEVTADAQAIVSDVAASVPVVPIAPTPVATPVVPVVANDDPLVADDADLIEKEWVDKAKRIISSTKDDPKSRGEQVGRLQKDYLRKRYNKELGAAE